MESQWKDGTMNSQGKVHGNDPTTDKTTARIILFSSIALGASMLPELWHVWNNPKSASHISPLFLVLRCLFFTALAYGLFRKKDKSTVVLAWLSVWYVLCYAFILFFYYRDDHK